MLDFDDKTKIFLLIAVVFVYLLSTAQKQNLLSGHFSDEQLKTVLIPQARWTPFPKITDRAGWSKADESMMKA